MGQEPNHLRGATADRGLGGVVASPQVVKRDM
jgi:hypothetical protein